MSGPAAEWFDSIQRVDAEAWSAVAGAERFYLQPHYLATLEAIAPRQVRYRYLVVRADGAPVAVAAVQDLALTGDSVGRRSSTPAWWERALRAVGRCVPLPVRLCGNTFASSEHAFALAPGADPAVAAAALVDALTRRADAAGGGFDAAVIPDVDTSAGTDAVRRALDEAGFLRFETDPTMVVALQGRGRTLEAYVAGMTGKYRSRYRRVRRQGAALRAESLRGDALADQAERTAQLLDAVAARSTLRGSDFPADYFVQLEQGLGDAFAMTGYFLGDRLVGFGSTVDTPGLLVGHYVGLDYGVNRAHALYQNILWDQVAQAIALGRPALSLGRTASEIKGTVGARPRPVRVFLRWHDRDRTQCIAPLFRFVRAPAWTPRNPFPERVSGYLGTVVPK